ncbi:Wzz/FepE/Etk N-terminal domain-containing protein [Brevibacillus humidisoli]|uniref:YveK family protein n=1 Tax=Brevibacillus humidisoli TaxID=2895522 RepID=UPI001E5B38AA|nr:Wzz/FepE/Etk N-terminal domain-containing protein [Brevibacillus humidisoli]UFJ42498.1 Wzz/FepE/Etk N-terminal domain-containing protein [Brevibacillus humidisoli]
MDLSIAQLWKALLQRWVYMLVWCGLAVAATGLISLYLIEPEYEATTKLIVQGESIESVDYSQLLSNRELLTTYGEVMRSNQIAEDVIRRIGLSISPEELLEKLRIHSSDQSLIVTVSARDRDYGQAVVIANAFAQSFLDNIHQIMKVGNVTILDPAREKAIVEPVRPRPLLNMALALVVGIVLFSLFVLYQELINNTIRSEEEAEQLLGLPILGVIADHHLNTGKGKRQVKKT